MGRSNHKKSLKKVPAIVSPPPRARCIGCGACRSGISSPSMPRRRWCARACALVCVLTLHGSVPQLEKRKKNKEKKLAKAAAATDAETEKAKQDMMLVERVAAKIALLRNRI